MPRTRSSSTDTTVQKRIDEWKRRLVDLSRRNRLLYFRSSRSTNLRIIDPTPNEVFQRFAIEGRAYRFWSSTPDKDEVFKGQKDWQQISEISIRPQRRDTELASDIIAPKDLVRILKNLKRRSDTDFEERGVRILFIAFGMLRWRDEDHHEDVQSPLLLVPAELKRRSAHEPFEIRPADEDHVLNPALVVKLSNDFRIDLPSIPEDWDEQDLFSYFAEISQRVKRKGWQVNDETCIGLFSFHKLVIHRDLHVNTGRLSVHALVRALAGQTDLADDRGEFPEPEELDRKLHPKDSLLVVDADSSQLAAIEAVKQGTNLVLHGPPGTGKSQTITNVIAEFLARGKTVLFVSEKMAALEVVFRRLKQVHLDHFCLELHSHRANKRVVVQELYRTLNAELHPRDFLSSRELEDLVQKRRDLANYVSNLHTVRHPFEQSVFGVLGELCGLEDVPLIAFEHGGVDSITPPVWTSVTEAASRLQAVWHVATEGDSFPWKGWRETTYSRSSRLRSQELLGECVASVETLLDALNTTTEALGVLPCNQLDDCPWLIEAVRLLESSPRPDSSWLIAPDRYSLIEEVDRLHAQTQRYRNIEADVLRRHGAPFLKIPPSLAQELHSVRKSTNALLQGDGTDEKALLRLSRAISQWAFDLADRTNEWVTCGEEISEMLGFPGDPIPTTTGVHQLLRLIRACESEKKPEEAWFNSTTRTELKDKLPIWRDLYESYRKQREELLSTYTPQITDLDLDRLVDCFAGTYATLIRWLIPRYYRDRKAVAQCSKNRRVESSVFQDLSTAREVREKQMKIEEALTSVKNLLGTYCQGYETDFGRVEEAFAVVEDAINLSGTSGLSEKLKGLLSLGGVVPKELLDVRDRLVRSMEEARSQAQQIGSILPFSKLPTSGLHLAQTPLREVREWAGNLGESASRLADLTDEVTKASSGQAPDTISGLIKELEVVQEAHQLGLEVEQRCAQLRQSSGERFCGLSSPWEEIKLGLQWVATVRDHFSELPVSREFEEAAMGRTKLTTTSQKLNDLTDAVKQRLASLDEKFDQPPKFSGLGLTEMPLELLLAVLAGLRNRVDDIRDWIDFKALQAQFEEFGLADLFAQLVSKLPPAGLVPKTVQRSVLQKWIDHIFEDEPSLGRFKGEYHENLISEFRRLDNRHWQAGSHRVIEMANGFRPNVSYVPDGSELHSLKAEALKQRRHPPIRRLFERIPQLLPRLKPCLLMSPLSVSQFLSPDMTFDLVVFDEASQMCSEDAVGAIYRSKQVLVCGDNKQLPPTPFFQSAMSEEFDEDDEQAAEEYAVLESILDDCLAVGIRERWLKWHYRSRHEGLIAFSNRRLYDSRLITFPSSVRADSEAGVHFFHVSDGVYDRGGRRNNRREAEVVADIVFDHFKNRPDQSLGVVAFSQAQMETIEDELEHRLKENPELEPCFSHDREDSFFVKNLENVQGDERDVVVISVGYGRDMTGRLTMSFGPVNQSGGERRLNVAITRAKDKVIVVSSLRAADLNLAATQAPGVLMLHKYLEYAEKGISALDAATPSGSGVDFESPLESDVAHAIRGMGYDVIPQVGCSEFRIDLGVLDPANPGRFVLGIECDGAMYHSSYVARDKDRLRQSVLERLGWSIHRVWSPEWANYRERETERLRTVIQQACEHSRTNDFASPAEVDATNVDSAPSPPPQIVENHGVAHPGNVQSFDWAVPYQVCTSLSPRKYHSQFHMPDNTAEHARLIEAVVQVEGPIHVELVAKRIANAWGLQRVGGRMQAAIQEAIERVVRKGHAKREGDFLWPTSPGFSLLVRVPVEREPETLRQVQHISPTELGLAMNHIISAGVGITKEALVTEVTRVFGFARTGQNIRDHIEKLIRLLMKRGTICQDGELIHTQPIEDGTLKTP